MDVRQIYEGEIYKITNILTEKLYIGSTIVGFNRRKISHISHLRNNTHHSKKLQNSWNKYGEDNFKFEIIETCNSINILEREQYWINYYDSYSKGYNATPIAGNCKGREVKETTKLKISNSLKGRRVNRTIDHNRKLSIARYKPVIQYDKDNNIINRFTSATAAAISLSTSQGNISSICLGIQKSNKFNVKYE
jgi:hypothetical protein